jgi:hypothetical protein
MPSEYTALVAALKLCSTPIAEYGWKARPEGAYRVIQLDFEAGSLDADGGKADRAWEGSIDQYYPKLTDRDDLNDEVEEILTEILGNSWSLNSTQYENGTGLFHVEWVFQYMDTPEEPEPEPTPEGGGTDGVQTGS